MIKKRDIAVTTTLLNEFIEDYIRRYPEDWFWLHTVGSGLVVSTVNK